MKFLINYTVGFLTGLGDAVGFLGEVLGCIFKGRIRWAEVFKQVYEQGMQSVVIIALASAASGMVLALQGFTVLSRFGAKEYIAPLVGLSLVRELSPVFGSFIFSGKAGARIAAELGTMNVNEQMMATRTLGVDPVEFLAVPRMVACFIALPILIVFSEVIGIFGGAFVGIVQAHVPNAYYFHQTLKAITFVDFFSGFIKTVIFAVLIGWICCYQGFVTRGGSLGVGRFTTKAVALSYIVVVLADVVLTKIILTFWG